MPFALEKQQQKKQDNIYEEVRIAKVPTVESVIELVNEYYVQEMIKNDLFLRALKGETVERPPVWMMRQAGRYFQNSWQSKRNMISLHSCQTPELASEITVQPIRRYGMDAAILFSDILVIPQAMNIEVANEAKFWSLFTKSCSNSKRCR